MTRLIALTALALGMPQIVLAQEPDNSLSRRVDEHIARVEREFGRERCDQLDPKAVMLRIQCSKYSTASDRSSFFMHLEGCKRDFPAEPDLWEYCVRKAEVDTQLLHYCSARVEHEAGMPTRMVGPLADAWWAMIDQCFKDVWAKLLSKQALSGYALRSRAAQGQQPAN